MLIVAGFALVYPSVVADVVGLGFVIVVLAMQLLRKSAPPAAA